MRIFLSVAGPDRRKIEPVALALRGRGYTVFLDEDILKPGFDFHNRIRDEIMASDLVVFFISPTALETTRYTLSELRIVKGKWAHPAGRVLPVMLEHVPMERIPNYLQAVTLLKPSGNLAATVSDAVVSMAERLRPPPRPDKVVEGGIWAVGLGLLAGLIYFSLRGWIHADLKSFVGGDQIFLVTFALLSMPILVLIALAAQLFHVHEKQFYVTLLLACALAYLANGLLVGQQAPPGVIDVIKSAVFAGVLAASGRRFGSPTSVSLVLMAGLISAVFHSQKDKLAVNEFLWEALTVAACVFVLSNAGRVMRRAVSG